MSITFESEKTSRRKHSHVRYATQVPIPTRRSTTAEGERQLDGSDRRATRFVMELERVIDMHAYRRPRLGMKKQSMWSHQLTAAASHLLVTTCGTASRVRSGSTAKYSRARTPSMLWRIPGFGNRGPWSIFRPGLEGYGASREHMSAGYSSSTTKTASQSSVSRLRLRATTR